LAEGVDGYDRGKEGGAKIPTKAGQDVHDDGGPKHARGVAEQLAIRGEENHGSDQDERDGTVRDGSASFEQETQKRRDEYGLPST
jgi:hypothetical protein